MMSSRTGLSFYVHIPYCLKRCGYCDFNTYTPAELKVESTLQDVSAGYIDLMLKEIEMARFTSEATYVPTIFFGGGTPSLMEPSDLSRVISKISDLFTLAADCEITMEANPDTLTLERLQGFRSSGINRLSIGMQSAVPHVLQVLDRTHNPANISAVVRWARQAGFEEISLDLIYGTPTESMTDWTNSIEAALKEEITHISAYALIVETGTKLAAQVKRGEVTIPDDDETAQKYRIADDAFTAHGLKLYEVSNWGSPCRHNVAYWNNDNWWGVGPGAHSHIDGKRWWNVKHPTAYRERLEFGQAPMQDFEVLNAQEIAREQIMLAIRMPGGLKRTELSSEQIGLLAPYLDAGFVEAEAWERGELTLTQSGRLIADRIVRDLVI